MRQHIRLTAGGLVINLKAQGIVLCLILILMAISYVYRWIIYQESEFFILFSKFLFGRMNPEQEENRIWSIVE